jgi:hypothetical protein
MMKKISVFIIAMLMASTSAFAAPFLTCDPYDSATGAVPTHFYLIFDTAAEVNSPAVTGWGPALNAGYTMKHDLASLTDGNHTVKAKACIMVDGVLQDCSEYSDPLWAFSKGKPAAPSILSIKEGVPPKYYLQSPPYAKTVMGGPPSSFNVAVDGAAAIVFPALTNADGATYLKYEITNIPTGTHTLNISAVNDWGAGATVAYTFQRYVVIVPKSIKILK